MFCKICNKPCMPQFDLCFDHRQEIRKTEISCTYCGLDRIEKDNPLVLIDDEHNEVACMLCIECEGLIF